MIELARGPDTASEVPVSDPSSIQANSLDQRTQRRIVWILFWGFWTAYGVVHAAPRVLVGRAEGRGLPWSEALPSSLLEMYAWGLVALAAFWLSNRILLRKDRWGRTVLVLLAAGICLVLIRFWVLATIGVKLGLPARLPTFSNLLILLPFYLLFYFALVGVGYAAKFKARELEASKLEVQTARLKVSAAELETRLMEAQLQALKSHIQPHFLFNTLNAIATLIRHDPDKADRMISQLADLLRTTLAHRQDQEVTVREEIELLEPYLEIERTRFGDRLAIDIEADPATREARMPHLILQPLVENAIRHGIAPRCGPGRVVISTAREGDELIVRVEDNGKGFDERARRNGGNGGIGLSNTLARLEQLYSTDASLTIEDARGGGTVIEIRIPFRLAGAPMMART
jgi:two-component system LytT family sensor kinase